MSENVNGRSLLRIAANGVARAPRRVKLALIFNVVTIAGVSIVSLTDADATEGAVLRVVALALTMGGCASYPQAESTLMTGISANKGHAADEGLPSQARTIAEKNHDLMWKVLFNIGGCEEGDIPGDVIARQAARRGN